VLASRFQRKLSSFRTVQYSGTVPLRSKMFSEIQIVRMTTGTIKKKLTHLWCCPSSGFKNFHVTSAPGVSQSRLCWYRTDWITKIDWPVDTQSVLFIKRALVRFSERRSLGERPRRHEASRPRLQQLNLTSDQTESGQTYSINPVLFFQTPSFLPFRASPHQRLVCSYQPAICFRCSLACVCLLHLVLYFIGCRVLLVSSFLFSSYLVVLVLEESRTVAFSLAFESTLVLWRLMKWIPLCDTRSRFYDLLICSWFHPLVLFEKYGCVKKSSMNIKRTYLKCQKGKKNR
jgi:hypothetical protein